MLLLRKQPDATWSVLVGGKVPAALKERIRELNGRCEYVINDNYNLAEGVVRLAEIDLSSGRQLDISTAVPSYLRQDFGQA